MKVNKEILMNEEAINKVVIPLIEAFIAALDSSSTKISIKKDTEELLESVKAASARIALRKLQKNAGPKQDPPPANIDIVV